MNRINFIFSALLCMREQFLVWFLKIGNIWKNQIIFIFIQIISVYFHVFSNNLDETCNWVELFSFSKSKYAESLNTPLSGFFPNGTMALLSFFDNQLYYFSSQESGEKIWRTRWILEIHLTHIYSITFILLKKNPVRITVLFYQSPKNWSN